MIPGGISRRSSSDRPFHRIGQTRTVNAYRLIAPGTVEEKIWELQQRKAQTISDVLGEEGFARRLDQSDFEYLFAED
jgi:SNF2 family DNA or RNA helicase